MKGENYVFDLGECDEFIFIILQCKMYFEIRQHERNVHYLENLRRVRTSICCAFATSQAFADSFAVVILLSPYSNLLKSALLSSSYQ